MTALGLVPRGVVSARSAMPATALVAPPPLPLAETLRLAHRVAALEAALDEAREEIARLRCELGADEALGARLGLTPYEAALLSAAMARAPRLLDREAAMTVLYGCGDGPDSGRKIFDVMWMRIRRKALVPLGLTVETVAGLGWWMTVETRDRLRSAGEMT